ncbi:uncharacterized protein TRAVEDRAFT_75761 [Trametes versicolor FP-101664 SS1]|uniref:Uncharacterized protein n=1 Tax=Trametes versicolor (strain FP-101664) TaxID=717944 RepID=R7S6J9_TRAVS|nr:uncharacterized protein TRAVEDRAFT_75761 [Trametes versicolor FP-101664 SS1]EIW51152.1 hypothetical protein TRAVEDRAFT_75761 [Trametes versicolor FP-101664 SS1]
MAVHRLLHRSRQLDKSGPHGGLDRDIVDFHRAPSAPKASFVALLSSTTAVRAVLARGVARPVSEGNVHAERLIAHPRSIFAAPPRYSQCVDTRCRRDCKPVRGARPPAQSSPFDEFSPLSDGRNEDDFNMDAFRWPADRSMLYSERHGTPGVFSDLVS